MLAGFGELCGLDRGTAFKLARGFGSGMGMGRECGAVTGAMLILGFKVKEGSTEKETRFKVYDLNREFIRLFEQKHGTIICNDLLGVDLNTPEGRDKAVKDGLFRTLCPGLVRDAAQILSDLNA